MPQLPACSYPAAVNILHFLRGHEQVKQQASMTGDLMIHLDFGAWSAYACWGMSTDTPELPIDLVQCVRHAMVLSKLS